MTKASSSWWHHHHPTLLHICHFCIQSCSPKKAYATVDLRAHWLWPVESRLFPYVHSKPFSPTDTERAVSLKRRGSFRPKGAFSQGALLTGAEQRGSVVSTNTRRWWPGDCLSKLTDTKVKCTPRESDLYPPSCLVGCSVSFSTKKLL